ncbi:MAG TPA: UDP-3-O-acyl-N-acetylglucosamine deacetylase [Elusimicrobiales bacterium]|nr:UDP-3-O-acyl-N-acetylglucosamine deacetylase [Elusimicrobiales bacterium]
MSGCVTLAGETSLSGIGLHGGVPCRATFRPSEAGQGLRFFRTDLASGPIPAKLEYVNSTLRGTNLYKDGAEVYTAEHALSACVGLGITDLDILLDAPEPPALDGSAKPYAEAFTCAGLKPGGKPVKRYSVAKTVVYEEGPVFYKAEPADGPQYVCIYESAHPLVRHQELAFRPGTDDYRVQIAPARTFAFEEEINYLRSQGLAKGGSLDNAVVIRRDSFLSSEGGLRFDDEMVRHKMLDMLGDLMLLGALPGRVKVTARGGGHKHNIAFARLLAREAVFREE